MRAALIAGVLCTAAPVARAGLPTVTDRPASLALPELPEGVSARHWLVIECRRNARSDGCQAQWTIEASSNRAASIDLPRRWDGPNRLSVVAGASSTAVLRRRVQLINYWPYVYGGGALRYRHILLGPSPRYWRRTEHWSLIVKVPARAPPQHVEIEVHHPPDWVLVDPSLRAGPGLIRQSWDLETRYQPRYEPIVFEFPSSRFNVGGPVAMLVLRDLDQDSPSAGGHLGFEVGYGRWLIGSIGAELDSDSTVAIAALSLHSPVPPLLTFSLSAGVGVPVRIDPDPDVGVRLFAELSFYAVGFGGGVDLFFGAGAAEADARPMMFIRASL